MSQKAEDRLYHVQRLKAPISIDADWDKPVWRQTSPLPVDRFIGEPPAPFPRAQAKVCYDNEALYVIFRIEDQHVICVTEEYQGPVWRDSCAEFFFVPGQDPSLGYFNLETNCGGAMLMRYQPSAVAQKQDVSIEDMRKIVLAHSAPNRIFPEEKRARTWTLEYRLPLSILEHYTPIVPPVPGVMWRANFYKCADGSSHPHWLSWSPIDLPAPDFHQPRFFGAIQFE